MFVSVAHKSCPSSIVSTATCRCHPRKQYFSLYNLTLLQCLLPCAEYLLSAEYSVAFSCRIFVFGRNKKIRFRSITNYNHQTFVTPLAKWGVPSRVPVHHCQQWWLNKEYNSAVSSGHPLVVIATTIVLVETVGRTCVTAEGEVKCKGGKV
jgi:hypothetical protein